ncbi:hypothetical protein [Sediminitomix flava]|uniref:Lipoprotein n=1 Tax=Sediminitomix flava TaxID=379075 RepID=A0A315ZE45_SEDFL|nr:hypothetical protein [Sediminitomix flava]PWJ43409.1 hypothetical protein BC781_102970 [Sediminitomix flava]
MKKNIVRVAAAGLLLSLTACFGQHNKAPNPGVNLDSKRIYGETREAKPRQLAKEHNTADLETTKRINEIRNELYPN